MVVDRDEAVSLDEGDDGDAEDDTSLLDKIKSYYRKVFSPARY
ncbi:MAG: hypothetical protein V5A34_05470 [Halapricum sp.]